MACSSSLIAILYDTQYRQIGSVKKNLILAVMLLAEIMQVHNFYLGKEIFRYYILAYFSKSLALKNVSIL
jgi:hypothetical protein